MNDLIQIVIIEIARMSYYVYVLKLANNKHYTGYTSDLDDRMKRHHNGQSVYTKEHLPMTLVWYCVFHNKYTAISFEKYLKSGSGRAFLKRHLI